MPAHKDAYSSRDMHTFKNPDPGRANNVNFSAFLSVDGTGAFGLQIYLG